MLLQRPSLLPLQLLQSRRMDCEHGLTENVVENPSAVKRVRNTPNSTIAIKIKMDFIFVRFVTSGHTFLIFFN
jgi:hypothetical protein